ncbi:uncharacterized protein PFL1_02321 [Pseudozyma flocculosa PF-1]|uniref:5-hydroxyisourate hydrolase n=1 Tax=Pseudozyma flocculosa TaxID=84751 RepID=A0A5C3F812_9BASI|nr:uncharacterized protein PFL1_02321 [Pseudozyma flocculosa PF-1]EPQ30205.1 hypothetical protein PFL1_02321 [Pseudozyma flocculosa PF-1]SPO39867.1 related to 5-hydroxyisourate hydrolase [Pseudozyma flocculosa]
MGSPITCHVLDASLGRPASGITAILSRLSHDGQSATVISTGETNHDGRIPALVPDSAKEALQWSQGGTFRITFRTKEYFDRTGRQSFYPFVDVNFTIPANPEGHYHVPLLLSPFSYTTYRGS